jgi:protein phosphatase-4 regulatory subunit 3
VILRSNRFRRDPRQMDEDEEMWFNNDDDEVDEIEPNLNDSLNYKLDSDFDQFNKKMEKKATLGNFAF